MSNSDDETATIHDVERFLHVLPGHIRGRGEGRAPCRRYVFDTMTKVLMRCTFEYPGFTVTAHGRSVLCATIDSLLKDGKITHDLARSGRWAGVEIVRKLSTGLSTAALTDGTMSWDTVICKVQRMLLTSALACRSGDIGGCLGDTHAHQFLVYKDIVLNMGDGNTLDSLVATVTICNEKGKK
jgi:hypothetical protein